MGKKSAKAAKDWKETAKPDKKIELSEAGERVLKERYLLKDPAGNLIETPEGMFWRVSAAIAEAEKRWGYSDDELAKIAQSFYEEMVERQFIPNSPTLMNAGAPLGQLSACFVPVSGYGGLS